MLWRVVWFLGGSGGGGGVVVVVVVVREVVVAVVLVLVLVLCAGSGPGPGPGVVLRYKSSAQSCDANGYPKVDVERRASDCSGAAEQQLQQQEKQQQQQLSDWGRRGLQYQVLYIQSVVSLSTILTVQGTGDQVGARDYWGGVASGWVGSAHPLVQPQE
jgi:hypothetical protein